jgi:hypothetical protein
MDAVKAAMLVCYEGLRLQIPESCDPIFRQMMRGWCRIVDIVDCWNVDPELRPSIKEAYSALNWNGDGDGGSIASQKTRSIPNSAQPMTKPHSNPSSAQKIQVIRCFSNQQEPANYGQITTAEKYGC